MYEILALVWAIGAIIFWIATSFFNKKDKEELRGAYKDIKPQQKNWE